MRCRRRAQAPATIHVHGTPVCFFIRSREVAEAHRGYFELLWQRAAKRGMGRAAGIAR